MNRHLFMEHISKWRNLKDNRSIRVALYIAIGILMYLSMLSNVMPQRLHVQLFSIAKNDILSPVTIVDKEATKEKQIEAAANVSSEYTFQSEKSLVQIEKAGAIFDAVKKVLGKANKGEQDSSSFEGGEAQLSQQDINNRVQSLKDALPGRTEDKLSQSTLETLVTATPSELSTAKEVSSTTILQVMSQHIKWRDLGKAKDSVKDQLPPSLNNDMEKATIEITKNAIVPNDVFNAELTKEKQQEAIGSVDPVMIREGQILAKKGQVINNDILHQLKVTGLLDSQFNPYPYIGLALLVLLLLGFVLYDLKNPSSKTRDINSHVLMYLVILFFSLLFMKITSLLGLLDIHGLIFMVPATMGTLLIKMLMNERLAIISSIVLGLCASVIFNAGTIGTMNVTLGIYVTVSGLAGVFLLQNQDTRSKIMRTGLWVSLVNMGVIIIFQMLQIKNFAFFDVGLELGFALLSGFIAAVLTFGLMPFFEAAFGILSSIRLIELSNPNHPLLRKILTEAPGTYHHSVMVANLADAACESIGANGLLARVGAYYHDIGKTKRPRFFVENQMNSKNPHDKISPQLSRTIIVSHPYDGADMLREHHLPKEIIDIAEQHHGTTLLKYFYQKAKDEGQKDVGESEFRYPGPKVRTKEAAIVEIADSVEAAVRSMPQPTQAKIEDLVKNIITDRLGDGQFDECDLTLKEIDKAAHSMCETLKGIFHERIEYPKMEDFKKKVRHA